MRFAFVVGPPATLVFLPGILLDRFVDRFRAIAASAARGKPVSLPESLAEELESISAASIAAKHFRQTDIKHVVLKKFIVDVYNLTRRLQL